MDRLLELLGQAESIEGMADDELVEYRDDLRSAADEAIESGDLDDDDIAQIERAAEVIESVEQAIAAREAEDAARQERVTSLRDRIRGEQQEEVEEGEGEEVEGEVEQPEEVEGEIDEPEAVAASQRRPGTAVTRVRSRRPDLMEAQRRRIRSQASAAPEMSLVAAANLGSISAGTPLDEPLLAQAMIEAYELSQGYRGPRAKVPVARIGNRDASVLYGEDRTLHMDSPESNTAKVARVTSHQALVASGGICAPRPVRYDLPTLGVDDRPFRDDALARFGADRGGIRTLPPPEITDFTGAVSAWTEANDQNPSDPTTKPCLTMTCPSAEETLVDAITRCIQVGNFRARFFPEQVQTWMEQAAVWHARFAETRLMTAVGTGSTQVTSGTLLGASIDVLTTLDRAVASIRSRRRLGRSFRMRFVAPFWLLDLMRTDIARQIGGGSLDEKMAAADAAIESWIRTRGVNITWTLDGETGQVFGAQGDGPLIGWPSTVVTYLYEEGSWLFLDGGTLDLGIIRDATLVGTNDYLVFAETFENVHFHGLESHRLTMDLCPDGSTAGTVDITPCATGS